MDKKKIYIIIIVLCIAVSAGVIYYGFFSSPSVEVPEATTSAAELEAARQAAQSGQSRSSGTLPDPETPTVFPVPRVFPQDTSLDLSVYTSAKLRALQDYAPLTVTEGEVGRENPFAPYQ
jgi:hypothetical protein